MCSIYEFKKGIKSIAVVLSPMKDVYKKIYIIIADTCSRQKYVTQSQAHIKFASRMLRVASKYVYNYGTEALIRFFFVPIFVGDVLDELIIV